MFRDNVEILRKAQKYLQTERQKHAPIVYVPGTQVRTAHITTEALRQTLADTCGNIKETARRFGVARGTIYRHVEKKI